MQILHPGHAWWTHVAYLFPCSFCIVRGKEVDLHQHECKDRAAACHHAQVAVQWPLCQLDSKAKSHPLMWDKLQPPVGHHPSMEFCQTQATMLPRGVFKYTWWERKEHTDSIVQDWPCRRIVCRRVAPLHISMMSSIYMEKERLTIEVRQITGVEREASDGSVKLCGSGPVTSGRRPMVHLTGVMSQANFVIRVPCCAVKGLVPASTTRCQ